MWDNSPWDENKAEKKGKKEEEEVRGKESEPEKLPWVSAFNARIRQSLFGSWVGGCGCGVALLSSVTSRMTSVRCPSGLLGGADQMSSVSIETNSAW